MQSDKIKYTAKYNKRFFTQLIFLQYYKRISIFVLTIGGVLSFLLGIGYLLGCNPFGFHTFPYFTLFYFLFVCLMPFYLKRKIEKKLDGHPLLETPIDFEFSPEGMNIIVHQDKKVIFWSQVHSIQNTTSAFLIYGTPHSFFYIVKSEMPTSDLKRLEEWMRASSKLV